MEWNNYELKKLTITGTVYSMEIRGLLTPFKSLEELCVRVVITKDTDVETLAKYLPVSLHYLEIKTSVMHCLNLKLKPSVEIASIILEPFEYALENKTSPSKNFLKTMINHWRLKNSFLNNI